MRQPPCAAHTAPVGVPGGDSRKAEPSSGCPRDNCQAQRGCPPWGSTLGLELQSPALLSVGIQRARGPRELPCVMCRSHASRRLGHGSSRGAVPAPGARPGCWLWSCASALRLGGTARCWPGPWAAPPALSPAVPQPPGHSPTHPCLRSRHGCRQREALGSCLPSAWRGRDERAVRALQPSPAVLSHLQSIRSPLKPGQAPASPWEKLERSLRPAGRGKEIWLRAIGCRNLCSCAWDVLVLEQAVWGSAGCVPSPDPPSLLTPTALGQDEHPRSPHGRSAPALNVDGAICFLKRKRGLHPRSEERRVGRV